MWTVDQANTDPLLPVALQEWISWKDGQIPFCNMKNEGEVIGSGNEREATVPLSDEKGTSERQRFSGVLIWEGSGGE